MACARTEEQKLKSARVRVLAVDRVAASGLHITTKVRCDLQLKISMFAAENLACIESKIVRSKRKSTRIQMLSENSSFG